MIITIAIIVVCSTAINLPLYLKLRAKLKLHETHKEGLVKDRAVFNEHRSSVAAAHAHIGVRLCSECRRVVHTFVMDEGRVICVDCMKEQ